MAINFNCPCGEPLEIDNQYAGMNVECPECNGIVMAPERNVLAVAKPVERKRQPVAEVVDDEDDDDDRPRRRRRRPVEDEDDYDDRPRRRKRTKKKAKESQSLEGKVWSGSAMGGLLAMLIAVVWFVGGLFADIIFFYPPILFIIGLVGLIRGLVAGDGDE